MKLVIVGGCGSSGTTLLAHLLSRHPMLVSGPEMNFFNHKEVLSLEELATYQDALFGRRRLANGYKQVATFLKAGKAFGIDKECLTGWVEGSNSIRELYEKFADHFCIPQCASFFLEKTPTNVYNFSAFSKIFPEIPLIHQVRDGRDVVASLLARGKSLFEAGSRWLYDTIAGLGARGAPAYLETRYEELVSDPETTLGRIFRHLGLPPKTDLLHAQLLSSEGVYAEDWRQRVSGRAWQQTPEDPISTKSVGRYQEILTPTQLSTLYRIRLTAQVLQRLGAPANSFGSLLDFLGYRDAEANTQTYSRLCHVREWVWQARDYYCRARHSWHHVRRLPPLLTKISR